MEPLDTNNDYNRNETTLREQITNYLRHWPWFILTVLLSLTVAYLYLRYTTPLYQSKTSIVIKDSKGRGAASELAAFQDIGLISGMNSNSIENEIEILRSKRLLTRVARELNLNIRYFKEGKFKTTELFSNKPFTVKILEEKEGSLPEHPLSFTVTSPLTLVIRDPEKNTTKEVKFGDIVSLPFADIIVVPDDELSVENGGSSEVLVSFSNLAGIVSSYQRALQISSLKGATIVEITLNHPIKKKAESILNELVIQYNKDAIEDRNLVAMNTALFIEERLKIIAEELDSVETGKVEFKQENQLVSIESEAQIFVQGATEFSKKQLELATQLELVNDVLSFIRANTEPSLLLPANLGITDSGLGSLISAYNQLVLERNRLLRSSTEQNPVIVNLTSQIMQLRGNLIASLENVKNSLQITLRDFRRQEATYESEISKVPSQEKQFRDIERQQNIKEALYLFLLQKREETSLSLAVTAPNAKIVDAAYSTSGAISPKPRIVLLTALIIGLVIPFLVIYIHQLLYDKVESRKDLERGAREIPIVGEVPKIGKNEDELIGANDRSILAESFRILRTNLQYLFANSENSEKGKILYITSTVKGEGKTFTGINLAITLANAGKKVILVGGDIRNPQIHRYIPESKNAKGVTDFLVSGSLKLNDLTLSSGMHKNLDFLFSGSIPPNPAELWMNERVPLLFQSLKEKYDYAIIDTAPAMLVTDTLLISKYADVTLYVVRANYTERKLLEFAVDTFKEKKLENMAFVLNSVKIANFGYGNKYGYSYGQETQTFWGKLKASFR